MVLLLLYYILLLLHIVYIFMLFILRDFVVCRLHQMTGHRWSFHGMTHLQTNTTRSGHDKNQQIRPMHFTDTQ